MSGALSAGILAVVLGLALARCTLRLALLALLGFAVVAVIVAFMPLGPELKRNILAGCWISAMLIGALTYLPKPIPFALAALIGLWAGGWAGAVIATSGRPLDLAAALPWALIVIPAHVCIRRGWTLVPKILASWLVAVALLGGMLALTTTPGYVPDHMD